jgi:hypothetical protein
MNNFPNRKWLVIPATLVDQIDFNQVLQHSAETMRYSLDGSKTFVKYDVRVVEETYTEVYTNVETGEQESYTVQAGVYGRPAIWTAELAEYDHASILALLATEEWTNPNPIDTPQL